MNPLWLAELVTLGAAVFWFVRAKQARAERDDARWALERALRIEVRPGAKVYSVPRREEPKSGDGAA